MRAVCTKFLGLALVFALSTAVRAEDKKDAKEQTLKGTITCAKCDLKKEKSCMTVIKVKGKDDKETVYYFDTDSHKKNHKTICTEAKEGEVTGKVSKDGKKQIITVSKVKFND